MNQIRLRICLFLLIYMYTLFYEGKTHLAKLQNYSTMWPSVTYRKYIHMKYTRIKKTSLP